MDIETKKVLAGKGAIDQDKVKSLGARAIEDVKDEINLKWLKDDDDEGMQTVQNDNSDEDEMQRIIKENKAYSDSEEEDKDDEEMEDIEEEGEDEVDEDMNSGSTEQVEIKKRKTASL